VLAASAATGTGVVLVLASRAALFDDANRAAVRLPGFGAALVGAGAVLFALSAVVTVAVLAHGPSRQRRARQPRSLANLIATAVATVVLAIALGVAFGGVEPAEPEPQEPAASSPPPAEEGGRLRPTPLAFAAALALVLGAIAAAAAVAHGRGRGSAGRAPETVGASGEHLVSDEAVRRLVDDAVEALLSASDPRTAILAAHDRFEAAVAARAPARARRAHETPDEFVARLASSGGSADGAGAAALDGPAAAAAGELVALVRLALYSTAEIEPAARERALRALAVIRPSPDRSVERLRSGR